MTIRHIEFDEPVPQYSTNYRWSLKQTDTAVRERPNTQILLAEGNFDITPHPHTSHKHEIVVFDTGVGLYRTIPRRDDTVLVFDNGEEQETKTGRGKTFELKEGSAPIIISSDIPGKPYRGIYSIVVYEDGPTPRHEKRVRVERPQSEDRTQRVQRTRPDKKRKRRRG